MWSVVNYKYDSYWHAHVEVYLDQCMLGVYDSYVLIVTNSYVNSFLIVMRTVF